MLPSARRAELSRQYFDNSYLSRKAFEGEIPQQPPVAVRRQQAHLGRDYGDSDSSDNGGGSSGSTMSGDIQGSRSSAQDSAAGQIWEMLCSLDALVLRVQANRSQCERLGSRLAALKKPMMEVHWGRQGADPAVLSKIKDLVSEAQHFMERFLDPDWWRKCAGCREDSEVFRELTFRLGFLMQAPPGFLEQSQLEDQADRLRDYADLQATLEDKLRVTHDDKLANEITTVLRRVRMRVGTEGNGAPSEIGFERLHFLQEQSLGNGGFGTVMAATFLDGTGTRTQVAVKKFNHQNVPEGLLEGMRKEVEEFHAMQYDFVVRTLGACTMRPNLCVVQERAATNLFDLLHKPDTRIRFSSQEKSAMLYDVARGLQYLHIKGIVHGNVKSTNVLVFDSNHLKVSDFGLIALRESHSGYGLGGGDTVPSAPWTAPEVLDDQSPSALSDVYSFGILIHEVLTQRVPFAGKGVAKVITAVVAKGHRPGYLEHEEATFPPGLVKLADVCWTQEPTARPRGLAAVVTELGHIVNSLGGDPRSQPVVQTAGESAFNMPVSRRTTAQKGSAPRAEDPGSALAGTMTDQERRIYELEQELLSLKMQHAGGGGGGDGGSSGDKGGKWYGVLSDMLTPPTVIDSSFSHGDVGIPEERMVLRSLYTSTQGPGWTEQAGWETNERDISRWHGVVCGENGHVIALQLPSNNLQGQIPRELASLSHLRSLILSDNFLEGPMPLELGSLEMLTVLDLSMNDLTGAIPATLANASRLERVHLQCNGFNGNVPRSLQKLENLKVLVLDWRKLSDTHPLRKFRKASPPPTDAEVQRAQSESRSRAVERAMDRAKAAQAHSGGSSSQQQQQQQQLSEGWTGFPLGYPVPMMATAGQNRGSLESAQQRTSDVLGGIPNKFKPLHRGGGFGTPSASRPQSPLSRCPSGAGDAGGGQVGRPPLPRSQADSGHSELWSNSNGRGGYDPPTAPTAPTAPYRGKDGMDSKAKASASASASAPAPGLTWKKALKVFKGVVGTDLHPGFTVEQVKEAAPGQK